MSTSPQQKNTPDNSTSITAPMPSSNSTSSPLDCTDAFGSPAISSGIGSSQSVSQPQCHPPQSQEMDEHEQSTSAEQDEPQLQQRKPVTLPIPPIIDSNYPPPPNFYANYAPENVKNGHALPPPPVPSRFTTFDEELDMEDTQMVPSLADLNQQQLYSTSSSWKEELRKLNRSIVANFLDLLEILISCPDRSERQQKLQTLRSLFINIHHLINEYRPIQARYALREMIGHQNKEIKKVTRGLQKAIDRGNNALEELGRKFDGILLDDLTTETLQDGEETSTSMLQAMRLEPQIFDDTRLINSEQLQSLLKNEEKYFNDCKKNEMENILQQ